MDEAIRLAKTFPEKIFIAGGAMIYNEGLKFANRMHLSFIKGRFTGNILFPDFNPDKWDITKTKEHTDYIYKELIRKT